LIKFRIQVPWKFKTAIDPYRDYWRIYGGLKAISSSPYVLIAALLSLLMSGIWTKEGWWDTPLAVLPNLVGFTLGGMALLTGWSNSRFISKLMGRSSNGDEGPFLKLVATFTHFLLVQIFSILFTLVAKSRPLSEAVFINRRACLR
jgi:hypothetical protein